MNFQGVDKRTVDVERGVILWAVWFASRRASDNHHRGGDYVETWFRSCDSIIRVEIERKREVSL